MNYIKLYHEIGSGKMKSENMPDEYYELKKKYELINTELENEITNLKYLLENSLIEYINLLNIHYIISNLINKRNLIKSELYIKYDELLIDEI